MDVRLEDDDPNPSEYQLVMDGDELEMDIPNLIYPFSIIMSTCTISAAAYISLSKKRTAQNHCINANKCLIFKFQSAAEYQCLFTKL